MTQDYTYSTHPFAGIQIDSFITEDGRHWATLTPLAQACGGSRQNMVDWVARKGNLETLDVKVGKFKKAAKAYLISDIGDYLDYRVELGDKKALALYSATFRADLERSIKEAHGQSVTAAQHEDRRATIRMELIDRMLEKQHIIWERPYASQEFQAAIAEQGQLWEDMTEEEQHVYIEKQKVATPGWVHGFNQVIAKM
ncbi:hypothetical protein [Scytonema sp. PCC 10023]|uniref:hypothetical protein n=1 Tax=Scytonema sp. PCC 10023 TaxID=1680591 RepID=UPI0039C6907D